MIRQFLLDIDLDYLLMRRHLLAARDLVWDIRVLHPKSSCWRMSGVANPEFPMPVL